MVNIHPSLLPKYQGLHTHERAIAAGDSHGGCTGHLVTPELDDGPMLGQIAVAILPGDSADSLAARVLFAEHQLYARCLGDLGEDELRVKEDLVALHALSRMWRRASRVIWPPPLRAAHACKAPRLTRPQTRTRLGHPPTRRSLLLGLGSSGALSSAL